MDLASLIFGGNSSNKNSSNNDNGVREEEPVSWSSKNEKNSSQRRQTQQPAAVEKAGAVAAAASSLVGAAGQQPNKKKRKRPEATVAAAADVNSNHETTTTKQSNNKNNKKARGAAASELENSNPSSCLSALPPLDLLYNRNHNHNSYNYNRNRNGNNHDDSVLPDADASRSNSDVHSHMVPNNDSNSNSNNPNRNNSNSFVYYPAAERKAAPTVLTESRRRSVAHQGVRDRFRQRRLDLRSEPDVGRAVAIRLRQSRRMVQQQQLRSIRRQQQQQQQRQLKKRQQNEAFDESDSDSEDELDGEAMLLSQLTQQHQRADGGGGVGGGDENTATDADADQRQTDYWEYGLTAPATVEPVVYDPLEYPKSIKQKQQQEEQQHQRQQRTTRFQQLRQEHYGTAATAKTTTTDQKGEDALLFQVRHIRKPIRHARVTTELCTHNDPLSRFAGTLQRRQIFRAAARYLTTANYSSNDNNNNHHHDMADRWIRLLWKLQHRRPFAAPPLNDDNDDNNTNSNGNSGIPTREARTQQYKYWSHTLLLSQDQCRRAGTALRDFLSHSAQFRGTHRVQAAEKLGLLLSKTAGAAAAAAPPDHLVGASMEVRDRQKDRKLWQTCLIEFGSSNNNDGALTEWKPPPSTAAAETPPPLLESDETVAEAKAAATASLTDKPNKRLDTTSPTTGTPLLEPTTRYLHLPGTVPPTPSFPLDVVHVIFGPPDRHEQVLHAGFIDEGVAKLTQSSLLVQLCEQQQQQQQQQQQPNNKTAATAAQLQKQLRAVLEQRVRLNQHKLYLRCQRQLQMKAVELPLQFYHRAVADYCSYVLINNSAGAAVVPLASTPTTTTTTTTTPGQEGNEEDREDDKEYDNSVSDSVATATAATAPTLKAVADHLLDFLDQHLEHNGLQLFGDLHVTFGLLRLAHGLPARSVALLARPLVEECDDDYDISAAAKRTSAKQSAPPRTPFDLIRDVLEDLEDRGSLVDHLPGLKSMAYSNPGDDDQEALLYAGELEYALHRSATVFARCVQREPTNAVYHAWHLAALAGSLLLCSGHRIGGAAHPYPSGRRNDDHDGTSSSHLLLGDGPDEDDDSNNLESRDAVAPHEVRRALPKLNDLRRDAAEAFRRLAHLAQHQRGNRAHRIVAAFLEWRQVVALLLGPPPSSFSETEELDRECYQKVRELHRYHQTEWALQERTEPVLDSVLLHPPSDGKQRTKAAADQVFLAVEDHNRRLEGLACALEGDPSSIRHWRALADALGPVGRRVPVADRLACHGRSCQECGRTLDVLNVEHHRHDRPGNPWWGRGRCDWWHDCLLQPSPESSREVSKIAPVMEQRANDIASAIQEALSDVEPIVLNSISNESVHEDCRRDPPSLEWLDQILADSFEQGNDGGDQFPPAEVRRCSVDRCLPRSIRGESRLASFSSEESSFPLELTADDPDHTIELMAYKILILCHMYGVCHKNVDRMVHAMVLLASGSGKDAQKGCNAHCCLQWLYRLGLDVATVFRQVQPTAVPLSKEKAARARKKRKSKPAAEEDA